uniref:Uncharacterized protein n=1 Tax=Macaca mulatta TaxID=9544 RepID=A0A5F7ZJE7_MACMU
MRPGTGQPGHEAPGEPGPNLRQRWPLLLLGLALVTHGLVHPTAAPQSRALGPGAPGGSSRSSLRSRWGRFLLQHGSWTGPRCWPREFQSKHNTLRHVFGSRTQLTVLGKWLSQPFPACPTLSYLWKSVFSLWGFFPSALPALSTDPCLYPWGLDEVR